MPPLAVVAAGLSIGLLLSSPAVPQAPPAQVSTTAGVRTGRIEGWLMFRQPLAPPADGVAYLLVEGATILRIDTAGVHLRPGTRVVVLFVSGDGVVDDYAPLGVAFRFAQKMAGAAGNSVMEGNINIDARCCRVTTVAGSPVREQLLGEFRHDTVEASIRVTDAGSTTDVPIADIVKFKEQPWSS